MGKITLIAAIGKNRELGKNNDLIWSIPEDLKFFRNNTINKTIVMGLNTFYSLPKLLPNRHHIVLSHKEVELDSSVTVFHSMEELLKYINSLQEEVIIIGGSMMYKQFIEYADEMILTEIDDSKEADVYFPEFSLDNWNKEIISNHEYDDLKYSHIIYTRKGVK
ncbi:MAG: dihydrofolate reductase [Bacilli bacterium]|nr:dihydrofolate reductase [Bacilli bacterium]